MEQKIRTITLALPYRLGSVNCYLIKTGSNFILIDTGGKNRRGELCSELESAGCKPGNLKLVVLTHGDFDHIGNVSFLKQNFETKIAMHHDDSGMAELGDMFWNRTKGNTFIKIVASIIFKFRKIDRFVPDLFIKDGDGLWEYEFDAKVISIPGHSKGSIGILASSGELFCGDLFDNTNNPVLNPIMDDLNAANASIEKLRNFTTSKIYPGHGKPFLMEQIINKHQ